MTEQLWKAFVKWCNQLNTSAENGFVTTWPGVELVTTEQLLTKYPPAKDRRLRSELLLRARKEMGGIHCVSKAKW